MWHPITKSPPKEGRYLVRAPTKDPKKSFFGVAFWSKLSDEEKINAPEEYQHGFYVYPEEWTQFLTHWTEIPPFKERKKK